MAEDEGEARLHDLLTRQVPGERKALLDSHRNLNDLADYVERHYEEMKNPSARAAALEESKQYTVQSLASVAYQIHTLAESTLQLFDIQRKEMNYLESTIHHIVQVSREPTN